MVNLPIKASAMTRVVRSFSLPENIYRKFDIKCFFFSAKMKRTPVILFFLITRNLDQENADESDSSNNVICHQGKATVHSANNKKKQIT